MEAMAMSKPIITTDSVGCREVIENGRNGYIIPVKNALALAEKVLLMLSNKRDIEEFGRYSLRKVENEFSETFVIQQTMSNLYRDMGPF